MERFIRTVRVLQNAGSPPLYNGPLGYHSRASLTVYVPANMFPPCGKRSYLSCVIPINTQHSTAGPVTSYVVRTGLVPSATVWDSFLTLAGLPWTARLKPVARYMCPYSYFGLAHLFAIRVGQGPSVSLTLKQVLFSLR